MRARVRRGGTILAALKVAALMSVCAGAEAKTVQVGSPKVIFQSPRPFLLVSDTQPIHLKVSR